MATTSSFSLPGPSGAPLDGLLDLPEHGSGPWPAVVICHGFKGFMEWGFFPYLAALLADRGFAAVRFNLSGSGMRPGEDRVADPAAFRANTHSAELADLLAVMAATGREIAPGQVDMARLGLLGHSRGGGAAVLAAARPEWRERVRVLVTWAAVASFDRYTPEQKEIWRRDGELAVENTRTGQRLALGLELLTDLEEHAGELDVTAAASRVRTPWLIVHGEEDESVPVADAHRLDAAANASVKDLLLIPGAGHTFGSRHPFAGPTPHLIQALNATQLWFRRHLRGAAELG
ncbi:MAG TPA: alpha/beta fold hydrolase [Thermoanaerobaculia bacterium]|nr:alpha/beta fold hydrolase [Thermoanaerobaculia bacterium]